MTRSLPRPSLAVALLPLALASALAAAPALAQDAPPPPPPDLPQAPVAPAQQPPPVAPPMQPPPVSPGQPPFVQPVYPPQYPPQYPQQYPQQYPVQYSPYGQYAQPYMPPPQQPQQPRAADRERVPPNNWYGWQTLIAVAPFDIAMFAGFARIDTTGGAGAFAVGLAGRNLVPAVVHFAHGRVGIGFGSIGMHMASMATGVAIGYGIGIALVDACPATASCRNGFRGVPPGPEYGAIAGSMVGTVLDVVFFAHRTKLSWTASTTTKPTWAMAPFGTKDTAGLAAAGTF